MDGTSKNSLTSTLRLRIPETWPMASSSSSWLSERRASWQISSKALANPHKRISSSLCSAWSIGFLQSKYFVSTALTASFRSSQKSPYCNRLAKQNEGGSNPHCLAISSQTLPVRCCAKRTDLEMLLVQHGRQPFAQGHIHGMCIGRQQATTVLRIRQRLAPSGTILLRRCCSPTTARVWLLCNCPISVVALGEGRKGEERANSPLFNVCDSACFMAKV